MSRNLGVGVMFFGVHSDDKCEKKEVLLRNKSGKVTFDSDLSAAHMLQTTG